MTDGQTTRFEAFRPLMFAIAYRMLGSATEAEDIVQEAYLRYQAIVPEQITSDKALLSTIVTRLCLNQLKSARSQRETYIGPWLPEPVLTESTESFGPLKQIELYDSLSLAFLTLLEQLTPLERAVFLLREVFDYEYAEIAEIVGKEEAACRQTFSRGKKHIVENRPRFRPTAEEHRLILERFIQAVGTGNLDDLMRILTSDVSLVADGGGKARGAALHPLHGPEAVARFLLSSVHFSETPLLVEITQVNGEQAVILRTDGKTIVVLSISVAGEQVTEIRAVGNPDKLKWVTGESADVTTKSDLSDRGENE